MTNFVGPEKTEGTHQYHPPKLWATADEASECTETLETVSFEDTEFDEPRLSVTVELDSPAGSVTDSQVQQRAFSGWEIIRYISGETGTHEHNIITGDSPGNTEISGGSAVIDEGIEFRLLVRAFDVPTTTFEAEPRVQTTDLDCLPRRG